MVQVFPPRHVYFPSSPTHNATVILLHGRGSNGPELASQIVNSPTSSGQTLFDQFPCVRWVFPSARPRWSDAFQVAIGEWFDPDREDDEELSPDAVQSLRDCVEYLLQLVEQEVGRLGGCGQSERVILGGLSQGMAVALVAMICAQRRLGGVFGVMGWFPLAGEVEDLLDSEAGDPEMGMEVFKRTFLTESAQRQLEKADLAGSPRQTPVLLTHGLDDQLVDVRLGAMASETLDRLGFEKVEWKTYTGAPNDGHSLKVPEQVDGIVDFLGKALGHGES